MSNVDRLESCEIVSWLRGRAEHFLDMANELESIQGKNHGPITVQSIVDQMRGRSMRIGTVAVEMWCDVALLKEVMTPDHGFIRDPKRGWYKWHETAVLALQGEA